MRASVLLALSQVVLGALAASQAEPDATTPKLHAGLKETDVLASSTVEVQSRALVVSPGETFDVTARIDENLSNGPQQPPVLLGLQFVPVLDVDAGRKFTGSSELLWQPLEGDTANWSLKLLDAGNYRAVVFAQIPCGVHEPNAELSEESFALHNFKGIVQLVAVDINGDRSYPLPVIGGQTTAPLVNGVATFSQLQFLQAGTYKLIATAEGAQAAESAPVVITPPASRIIRVAVEVLLASGRRDTRFAGQLQLELDKDTAEDGIPQGVYKTHCRLGLCLWDSLLLTGPPGRHQLKATAVEHTASTEGAHRVIRPAISAPILFKEVSIVQTPNREVKSAIVEQKKPDIRTSLRLVQAVPSIVRVGQPWDLEVAVESFPSTLAESVLSRERSLRQRLTVAKHSAWGGWSSWTQSINLYGMLHREQRLKRLNSQKKISQLQHNAIAGHTLRVSIAKAWPENLISLTGQTEATTNEQGHGILSGLAVWLQEPRANSALQAPWVELKVECVTCTIDKGQFRSLLETPRIFLDVLSAVGVFKDVAAAASAVAKWRSAREVMEETDDLLDRPFADVLIKAQHGQGLTLLGDASIRISPYVWPLPACWQFAAAPTHQLDVHGAEQSVSFQLFSADSTFSSKAGVRWRGMADPDGSVRVIVLPSRSLLGPNGLRYMLRNPRSSHTAILSSQQIGQLKWVQLHSGPLRGRARLVVPKSTAAQISTPPPVASMHLVNRDVEAFLQWKAVTHVVELIPPQTKVVLELEVVGPSTPSVDMTGQCVDTDAGNVVLATPANDVAFLQSGSNATKVRYSPSGETPTGMKVLQSATYVLLVSLAKLERKNLAAKAHTLLSAVDSAIHVLRTQSALIQPKHQKDAPLDGNAREKSYHVLPVRLARCVTAGAEV
ncbi:LOW QUALITY PROTEIN: uncharacterized protein EMH_0009080 [Eimeria mitis]|uniref:Uncharacterized protein n=1 Tax=Eimeria mitis TaxID=44415 RepID=U6K196_9EIME|nr:LOW QUALITY PROTEIN: uncharacterized protein EMH_0009080 [Eimeria mitis]CDJ31444.1 hypothetical protein EMH_0009080 [Eimeria mitis]